MRKRLALVSALAALLLLGGGSAYASIPAPGGTINGCYKTSGPGQGALIVIDSAAACPSGTTVLNWNQTGPQGPAGTNGTNGANGVSGYEVVAGTIEVSNNGSNHTGTISCPSGKVALGSGVTPDEVNGQPSEGGSGWDYTFTTPGGGGLYDFRSSVTCATVSP